MRVISGKFKGKRLLSPPDREVRPTTDRIKETVFNILYSKGFPKSGSSVLDLFGGSGGLGIEALSRGAAAAVFVDSSPVSARLIRENLCVVGFTAEVFNADYALALTKLAGRKFDMIFLDPPYRGDLLAKALEYIKKYDILAYGGIIIAETANQNRLPDSYGAFIIDCRKLGNTAVTFLTREDTDDK